MHNKNTQKAIGLILIFIGIIALGNQLNIWHLPLSFSGWWSFLIIIPFLANIFDKGIKVANTVGFLLGLMFLLNQCGWLQLKDALGLLLPIGVITLGIVYFLDKQR